MQRNTDPFSKRRLRLSLNISVKPAMSWKVNVLLMRGEDYEKDLEIHSHTAA